MSRGFVNTPNQIAARWFLEKAEMWQDIVASGIAEVLTRTRNHSTESIGFIADFVNNELVGAANAVDKAEKAYAAANVSNRPEKKTTITAKKGRPKP